MSAFDVFRKPLTVYRPSNGAYVNGVWVESGDDVVLTINASVQPATTEDLQSLPESRRNLGAYRLYSSEPFQTITEGSKNPDIVQIYGDDYEIAESSPWQNGVQNHHKSLAVRVQR